MARKFRIGTVAATIVAAAPLALMAPLSGAAVGTAAAAGVGAVPLSRTVVDHAFTAPPTTAQCVAALGVACYDPAQFRKAYNLGPVYAGGVTGKGTTIAIVDSFGSPTIKTDLRKFDKAFGLPAPPSFTIIHPAGTIPPFDPNNATMANWAAETGLDVQYAHAMAPGANILLVETPVAETEGVAGFPQIVKAENYVISHHLADVISQSFAATEQTFPSAQSILNLRSAYVAAAKAGITVLAASGDQGATSASNVAGTAFYLHPVTNWPSSDPLVTGVGGLQYFLNQAGDQLQPPAVWNDTALLGGLAASGGGKSVIFSRPAFQNSVAARVGNQRGVPDISLSAAVNGGALVYYSADTLGAGVPAGFYVIGGTSEATPEFAGVVALAAQTAGHGLGVINSAIYQLNAAHAPGIVDITSGTNTVTFSQGGSTHTVVGFDARAGYDLSTGVGGINGADFVPELAAAAS
jgi:subtilase family serine protease